MPQAVNGVKQCACCRVAKAAVAAEFQPLRRSTDGLYSYCKACVRIKGAAYRTPEKAHDLYMRRRDQRLAYMAEYRRVNAEKIRATEREHSRRNPEKHREARLKCQYGITGAQYAALVASQGGLCAICRGPPKRFGLYVDHCHKTNVVRGLLCQECNIAIGKMLDSPTIMRGAAAYVEERVNGVFPKGAE